MRSHGRATLALGDLVICGSADLLGQLGLHPEVGMYLQDRRTDGMVLFPFQDRSAWLAKVHLRRVEPGDPRYPRPPRWLVRTHRAMALVGGSDVEFEETDGSFAVKIGCAELDGRLIRELEGIVEEDAEHLRIRPGSMSRVLVVFPVRRGGAADALDSGTPAS